MLLITKYPDLQIKASYGHKQVLPLMKNIAPNDVI